MGYMFHGFLGICSMGCWGYVPLVAGDMFQVAGDMFCCDGGKTKSTPSPTDLYWTVRLNWILTI